MRLPSLALAGLALAVPVSAAAQDPDAARLERARALLRRHPVLDGHNDVAWEIRRAPGAPRDVAAYDLRRRTPGHTDLARLREGGVGGQFWSAYVDAEARDTGWARMQLEQIDIVRRMVARYPEALALALTAADAERAMRAGRIASFIGMEGGHVLENSLGALRAYHALGARYLTLTHNTTLDWADAALGARRHGGLTPFGREVVREMNRLGMLVDLSHVSPETMHDALDVAQAPVIFSHSSARALVDHPRNVPDDVLARLAANGGVVLVTFVPAFVSAEVMRWEAARDAEAAAAATAGLDADATRRRLQDWEADHPRPEATLAQVADHIEHVRRVAGEDHVGLGGDFDGITTTPEGLRDVAGYPKLFAELLRRGWSEAALAKLASGNLLRALRGAEQVAARLQREREPSVATIEALDRR